MRAALLAAVFLLPWAESGTALTVVSQSRATSVQATTPDAGAPQESDQVSAAGIPGVPFVSNLTATALARLDDIAEAHASQLSQLDASASLLLISAGAAVLSFYDLVEAGPSASAEATSGSTMEIVFSLDAPATYALAGIIEACLEQRTAISGSADALVRAFFSLSGAASGVIHEAEVVDDVPIFDEVSQDLFFSGILPPDTYTFQIGATSHVEGTDDSFASGIAIWGIDFAVEVPEPSTGLLVGLALLVVASRAHVRERDRPHPDLP